ncbi:MAG: hypothetical protein MUF15_10050 [Acidobacteria bacterium]|jgi:hypothetical protein|nr:hypothetical protein [Acidobacteriota bacterium]
MAEKKLAKIATKTPRFTKVKILATDKHGQTRTKKRKEEKRNSQIRNSKLEIAVFQTNPKFKRSKSQTKANATKHGQTQTNTDNYLFLFSLLIAHSSFIIHHSAFCTTIPPLTNHHSPLTKY